MSSARRIVPLAVLLAIVALALGACGSDDDSDDTTTSAPASDQGLQVLVDPPTAAPGDTVLARIDNGSEERFQYGAAYELERQEGEDFVPVKLPDRPVPQIAYVANAGSSGPPVKVKIPKDALPGQYRVVIVRDAPDIGDLSGEFEVKADG